MGCPRHAEPKSGESWGTLAAMTTGRDGAHPQRHRQGTNRKEAAKASMVRQHERISGQARDPIGVSFQRLLFLVTRDVGVSLAWT